MVIKSEKGYYVYEILGVILIVIHSGITYNPEFDLNSKLEWCLVYGFCIFLIINDWIIVGRTLIMDERGCTVCFLWLKKEYRWEELKVKRIEDYRKCRGRRGQPPYKGGAVFSRRDNIHRPARKDLVNYLLFHPIIVITTFFVYFELEPEVKKKGGFTGAGIYEVDEKVFRENMKKWGVELEEPEKRYRR
ncbi:MAG: hypothetical protein Q4C91_05075 [Eubacteriales bacterium]|nr:hypothetical protein [Eubacteriales bacterium]